MDRPRSYIDGIKRAKLNAIERYRNISAGLSNRYHRDMMFEIITDELIYC